MHAFIDKYVRGCEQCQRFKPIPYPKPAMLLVAIPEGLWQIISTGLPLSKGINGKMYTAITTYVDLYVAKTMARHVHTSRK